MFNSEYRDTSKKFKSEYNSNIAADFGQVLKCIEVNNEESIALA